ncbi:outer membrane protein [Microvirga terricola]|uniref:Porin family protein n=1 Tax=Microvirga terricola TaxID=2719797 RepID=A0ABX0VFF4_9HYPH|nr:outer membrane protein [Microvirga terricola]NIX77415.1 porin family protein [Microvirga terricola]
MKKILLSSVALLGLTAGAMAADLPSRRAPAPVVPVAVPVFSWTGFYLGVNAGGAWNTNNDKVFVPGVGVVGGNSNAGFTGGGQIGYNYQMGMFVLGVETDLQYADLGRKHNDLVLLNDPALVALDRGNSNNFFGTVRARAGVAFDRALVYATGGFAYGDVGNRFGGNSTNGGWTVGGGIEYAFTNNLTAKVEGLYVNLERNSNNDLVALGLAEAAALKNKNNEFGVIRAGLNYKFNSF